MRFNTLLIIIILISVVSLYIYYEIPEKDNKFIPEQDNKFIRESNRLYLLLKKYDSYYNRFEHSIYVDNFNNYIKENKGLVTKQFIIDHCDTISNIELYFIYTGIPE